MAEVTRIDLRIENTSTGFASREQFLHLIDMPLSMQEALLDEVYALLKRWETRWKAYTDSQAQAQPQALNAAALLADLEATGKLQRGVYDPAYPHLSSYCEQEDHERCDEFGWIPWCQCFCHAPDHLTNLCYHGRHDLCPKQPAPETGLERCQCECHQRKE